LSATLYEVSSRAPIDVAISVRGRRRAGRRDTGGRRCTSRRKQTQPHDRAMPSISLDCYFPPHSDVSTLFAFSEMSMHASRADTADEVRPDTGGQSFARRARCELRLSLHAHELDNERPEKKMSSHATPRNHHCMFTCSSKNRTDVPGRGGNADHMSRAAWSNSRLVDVSRAPLADEPTICLSSTPGRTAATHERGFFSFSSADVAFAHISQAAFPAQ
jgi:hypothetical protein